MFFRIDKNSQYAQENACVGVSFQLKKRLQHSCFPVNIAKFLRTAFLQNISGGRLYIITFNTLQSRKSVAVSMFPIFYQFIKFI